MAKLGIYNIVVKAVVFNKNKVLILRRSKDNSQFSQEWDLPGGKLEPHETPEKGMHRELKEEAGITAEIIIPFNTFYWYSKEEKIDKIALNYIAEYKSGKLKISHEHEHAQWYDTDKIPDEVSLWVKETVNKAQRIRKGLK